MEISSHLLRLRYALTDVLWSVGRSMRAHPLIWLLLPITVLIGYVLLLIPATPSVGDIRKAGNERPTVLMSNDGKVLAEFRRANREWVGLDKISPWVKAALISTEDRRFYDHQGIDLRRTGAALVNTLKGERQGGSTITQQLARNLYPEEIGRSVSIHRKLKEAITAVKIERVYSKDEILETYLNTVPFLYNAYGIEMAARTYFDTSAAKLDALQSATLIGMLKGTSYYNPVSNPERAVERRNIVLAQMARQGALTDVQFSALKKAPLKVDFERQGEAVGPAPHLARHLRNWMLEWADRYDYDIYTDGLRVVTTIDSRLQDLANRAVQRQADQLQRAATAMWGGPRSWSANRPEVQAMVRDTAGYKAARAAGQDDAGALKEVFGDAAAMAKLREDKSRLQAGFLALDPRTGELRAWVGSRGYAEDQFDHVAQARRQPGSTFKPFVYGAAFTQGMSADDLLMDQPVEIALGGGQVWRPSDGGGPSYQPMSLRNGLAYSKNTITAQLMERVGPANVAHLARRMGVRQSKLEEVLALALGTSPVTLKEMVSAYGTIANGGSFIEPTLVTRIEDRDGRVLASFRPASPEPALAEAAAFTLLDSLRGAIDRGTGTAIRSRYGISGDVAGKTGTTQDNTDGWFILMHPQLVAGAWVGFNDSRLTMGDSWGQGARSALPMVGDFMQAALRAKTIDADAVFAAPKQVPVSPAQLPPEAYPGAYGNDPGGYGGFGGSEAGGAAPAGTPPSAAFPEVRADGGGPAPFAPYVVETMPPPAPVPPAELVQALSPPASPAGASAAAAGSDAVELRRMPAADVARLLSTR